MIGTPKVAIICHSHPSVSKGGAEISAYTLFRGLCEIGVDAIFIAACSEADRGRLAFAGGNEFAVFYPEDRYEHFFHLAPLTVEAQLIELLTDEQVEVANFHHFLHFGVNTLRAARALPALKLFFTMHEFLAICHHHGQMVTRPARLLCSESSAEACSTCYPEHQRTQFALRRRAFLDVLRAFDGHISPSRFLLQRYSDWGLAAERISVIENGLGDVTPVTRGPRPEGIWTFGYFGQINPFKGVDLLLDAAELIAEDAKLAKIIRIRIHGNLVGQSQQFIDRFERLQRELPLLTYSGPYNGTSVARLMSDCDYVVMPSRWWENSPMVIQEAYAVRTPVLCSGIGGLAEKVINAGSGLYFRVGEAADLVRTMKIAADPKVSERLRAGIPAVTSAADMARQYLRLFTSRSASKDKVAAGDTVG